jgi:hypothetical protein
MERVHCAKRRGYACLGRDLKWCSDWISLRVNLHTYATSRLSNALYAASRARGQLTPRVLPLARRWLAGPGALQRANGLDHAQPDMIWTAGSADQPW